jgi:hypothetical protein
MLKQVQHDGVIAARTCPDNVARAKRHEPAAIQIRKRGTVAEAEHASIAEGDDTRFRSSLGDRF